MSDAVEQAAKFCAEVQVLDGAPAERAEAERKAMAQQRDEACAERKQYKRAANEARRQRNQAREALAKVREAAGRHPECGKHPKGDPITVLALLDRLEDAEAAEDEHDQCPAQCPVCGDWATRTPCDHCKGSACCPGTALGGYEECEWCAGMGWLHEGCLDTGPSWQERAEAAEAELSNYRVNQGYFLTRESAMGKSHRFIGKEELEQ